MGTQPPPVAKDDAAFVSLTPSGPAFICHAAVVIAPGSCDSVASLRHGENLSVICYMFTLCTRIHDFYEHLYVCYAFLHKCVCIYIYIHTVGFLCYNYVTSRAAWRNSARNCHLGCSASQGSKEERRPSAQRQPEGVRPAPETCAEEAADAHPKALFCRSALFKSELQTFSLRFARGSNASGM